MVAAFSSGCGARTTLPGIDDPAGTSGSGGSGGSDDPWSSVVCDSAPPPLCTSASTLRSSISPGSCAGGLCSYATVDTVCQNGCTGAACNGTLNPLRIGAGNQLTCAVTTTGAVKCWGNNQYGQLGDNTKTASPVPVDVVGLESGVLSMSAAYDRTCIVNSAGGVKCWGANQNGELGNNSTVDSAVPVDVVGLSAGVVAVSPGYDHSCAITSAGSVQCWGWNLYGQLGAGPNIVNNVVPTDMIGLGSGALSVSAGVEHTCAITTAGHVKCWGDNTSGQLGNNSSKGADEPVDVIGF